MLAALPKPVASIAIAGLAALAAGPAFASSSWGVHLATGSSGEAQATTLPGAPASPAATCTSSIGSTIKVAWSAVAKASAYTVYESTTSATGTYSQVASGVTTTSWTSGTLANGNYWFEVTSSIGSNWTSAKSAATAQRTIGLLSCT